MNENKKQALPIQVLLLVIYDHSVTMDLAVLVWENVELNFYNVFGSNTYFLNILRETKAFRKIGKWEWEASIAYSSIALGNL